MGNIFSFFPTSEIIGEPVIMVPNEAVELYFLSMVLHNMQMFS